MKRSDFLRAVFPEEFIRRGESPLVSYPTSFTNSDGVLVNYYQQMYWNHRARGLDNRDEGWLYCVSTVAKGEKPRRRLKDVREAFVLPCDDVGTKVEAPPVAPSYILETSPGNFQYGYLLDPFDVSTASGANYYDACLLGLAQAGYNDIGCRSASRVIKLPGAIHRTGFESRLVEWHPERSWALDELMSEMGVRPATGARGGRSRSPGSHTSLDTVEDRVMDWLVDNDMVLGSNEDWVEIECPWAHLHSDKTASTAGYSPLDYGGAGRGFKCFHGHGEEHGLSQFLAWVEKEGGVSLDINSQLMLNRIRKESNDV